MNLNEIAQAVNAETICGAELMDKEITNAYACDLISDVVAFCAPGAMLISGLTGVQIVRAAQMLEAPALLFVRGKKLPDETKARAKELGIPVLTTKFSLFETCGKLYSKGMEPCYIDGERP